MSKSNSLAHLEAYKYYVNLTSRPEGAPLWEVDEDGVPNNQPGEVFCRYLVKTVDGIKMCDYLKVADKTLVRHIKDTHCDEKDYASKIRGRKGKGEVERLEGLSEILLFSNDDADAMLEFYDSMTGRQTEDVPHQTQPQNVPHATQSEIDEAVAKAFRKGYQQAKDEDAAELAEMKEELENVMSYKAEFCEWKEFMEERRKEFDTREVKPNEREQHLLATEAVEQAGAK